MLDVLRAEFAEISSDRKSLRSFGLVMGGVTAAVAIFLTWKAGWTVTTAAWVMLAVCAIFVASALAAPQSLRAIHRVWMMFATVLGFVMTRVILAIVFFVIMTPIGLLLRALGKDPLTKGPDEALKSYWIDKEYRTRDRDRLTKYY
ncbi:MAG: hypothetical protein KJO98_13565 [Rhodothermia bacterium]|nr:hypothetical protein [Rhodothermia bacterium]